MRELWGTGGQRAGNHPFASGPVPSSLAARFEGGDGSREAGGELQEPVDGEPATSLASVPSSPVAWRRNLREKIGAGRSEEHDCEGGCRGWRAMSRGPSLVLVPGAPTAWQHDLREGMRGDGFF
jgi:hypothetical protein